VNLHITSKNVKILPSKSVKILSQLREAVLRMGSCCNVSVFCLAELSELSHLLWGFFALRLH